MSAGFGSFTFGSRPPAPLTTTAAPSSSPFATAANTSTSTGTNTNTPSPFHGSFGPTPTAATVTPAAASGTTTAPAPLTAASTTNSTPGGFLSASNAGTSFTANPPHSSPFAVASAATFTSNTTPATATGGLFGSATSSTATPGAGGGLFGAPSSATTSGATAGGLFSSFSSTAAPVTSTSTFGGGIPPSSSTATPVAHYGLFFNNNNNTNTNNNSTPHVFGSTTASSPLFGSATAAAASAAALATASSMLLPNSPWDKFSKSIRFVFSWNHLHMAKDNVCAHHFHSKSDDYTFQCVVKRVENCYFFLIVCQTEKDFAALQWVNTGTIQTSDRVLQLTARATHFVLNRQISISDPILISRFPVGVLGYHTIEVILSNDPSLSLTPSYTSRTVNVEHCDSVLGRMLRDFTSHDVFFEFDVPGMDESITDWVCADVESSSTRSNIGTGASSGTGNGSEVAQTEDQDKGQDNKDRDNKDHDNRDQDNKNQDKNDADLDTNETEQGTDLRKGKGKKTCAARLNAMVSAHKIVLAQSEYFRTMFSSSFAEGGPGVKNIKIKDTNINCFRLLIEYLYMGRLGLFSVPRVLTEDDSKDGMPTWEDIYLVADRYNVADLRCMAAARIMGGLNVRWALPFLFRTAYLFEDLRGPVIKFVVQNNMDKVAGKDALAVYYNHAECNSILAEILAELWLSRNPSLSSSSSSSAASPAPLLSSLNATPAQKLKKMFSSNTTFQVPNL